MEIVQLRSFIALAEAGSVTAAADRLFLTQPAVTQQLRALEREVGVQLFDRTPRGVVLTQAGAAFKEYVERGLSTLEAGRRAAVEVEGGVAGTLTLGAGVTTSVSHLPGWLQRFQVDWPNVDVVVRTGLSADVARMVSTREIDLGFVTSDVDLDGLTTVPIIGEDIVLVRRSPPHRITVDELRDLPMIVFPIGSGFRDFLDRELMRQGMSLRVKMEIDSVEAIKGFVTVGLGAAFLPARAVAPELESGVLVNVDVDGMSALRRHTSAVYRTAGHRNAAVQGLLDIVTQDC